MNLKILYSLATTIIIGTSIISHQDNESFLQKRPVNTGPKLFNTHIHIETDTIVITDDMIKNKNIVAGGIYFPYLGTIKVNYMITKTDCAKTRYFCRTNNAQIPLTIRHETEHARKTNLTKNTWHYPPATRGAIAAQNEIIAPAAEIIEALDYRYKTGTPYPTPKNFIRRANKKILGIVAKYNLDWPLDFNNPKIATIIMQCATEQFLSEINRGVYRNTILHAVEQEPSERYYITNNLCNHLNAVMFNPQWDAWAPLWEFTSIRGPVNLWNATNDTQHKKLTNTVDSIVRTIAGQKAFFLKLVKTY